MLIGRKYGCGIWPLKYRLTYIKNKNLKGHTKRSISSVYGPLGDPPNVESFGSVGSPHNWQSMVNWI